MTAVKPMQQASIQQDAKQLHLPTLGDQFLGLAEEAVKEKQSHLSYLEALLEAEVEERDRKAVARRIQEAHFPAVKTLEEFDFQGSQHIPAAMVKNLSEGGYERHLLLYVLPDLHQVVLQSLVQQIHTFFCIDLARYAMLDQRLGRPAEGHADIHGGIAGFPHVLHLMSAVAGSNAHMRGRVDHLAGSFVVHHRQRLVRSQSLLIDKRTAQLCFAPGEEILHKILFHVQVLVEQLREQL